MEFVQASDLKSISNGPTCTIQPIPIHDKEIDMAIARISGRYPQHGWAVNKICRMMGFVLEGTGKLGLKDRVVHLSANDSVLIMPGEKYYWEGNMTLLLPSTPAWSPDQYRLID